MKKYGCIFILLFVVAVNAFAQQENKPSLTQEEIRQLKAAFEKIDSLSKPSEMPQRIELIRFVLTKISKDVFPEFWAGLQSSLGVSLLQNPLGSRAKNLEQAIYHYNQALKIFTKQAFPEYWADTQTNFASVYFYRIKGVKAENIEQAIYRYNQALKIFTKQAFPVNWAIIQNNLCEVYRNCSKGEKEENIEKAIYHCNQALKIYNKKAFLEYWGETQINLANAYSDRIKGKRAENVEKAIYHYNQILKVFTKQAFPIKWAMTQSNLALAYYKRIKGAKIENIEQSIFHYNQALTIYTKQTFPEYWANTQYNLTNAYSDRIKGSKSENIEQMIYHFNLALEIYTKQDFPSKWADTKNNLAATYLNRIKGSKSENIEQAIYHYNLALQIYTKQDFPEYWAKTQYNLGIAYYDRIKGAKAENIEKAIYYYNLALKIKTKQACTLKWAETQNNLANAYRDRIKGERAENIEQAIHHYNLALKIKTKQAFPKDWAMIQNNLAIAYRNRIKDAKMQNIEQAIFHYNQALKILTKQIFPSECADTKNNLAVAYLYRIKGERAENIEQAIYHCNQALKIRTKEVFPSKWAETQNNLGEAYNNRIKGKQAENIEKAIYHFNQTLKIYTKQNFPLKWAITKNNIAGAYFYRIEGIRAENIEKAIYHFNQALKIYTKQAFPFRYMQISENLGKAYFKNTQWQEAIDTFSLAEKAGEEIMDMAVEEEIFTKYLKEIQTAISYHSYALAKIGKYFQALDILEKGKARILNQRIFFQKIKSQLDIKTRQKLIQIQAEIKSLTNQLNKTDKYSEIAKQIRDKKAVRKEIIQQIKGKLLIETQEDWSIKNPLKKYAKAGIAPIAFNITPKGTVLLVFNPNTSKVSAIFLDEFTDDVLNQITISWVDLLSILKKDWKTWTQKQPELLEKLGKLIWPKLDMFLQKNRIKKILLIPHKRLFLFPLHATPFVPFNSKDKEAIYPLQNYTIAYTPSLRLHDQVSKNSKIDLQKAKALFVQDPDQNLGFEFAGKNSPLKNEFKKQQIKPLVLKGKDITAENVLTNMQNSVLIHYYGHGYYNWYEPEKSGLYMYSPDKTKPNFLTMQEIAETSAPNKASLVVLSACETGMTDIVNQHQQDQFIGLPAAFLQAGANAVAGSLWTVPNIETCLVFTRFYKELFSGKKQMTPALALRNAQLWILNATTKQITDAQKELWGTQFSNSDYSHPANWAAFYITGNGFAEVEAF